MPTIPNLIHPVEITVELIDFSQTVLNDRFGESVGGAARPVQYVLPGQVFDQDTINNPIVSGLTETVEGYVAFRVIDMQRFLPRLIQRLDRIVKFGSDGGGLDEEVDFYFHRLRRKGHYSSGSTMRMWWYRARAPTSTEGTLHRANP